MIKLLFVLLTITVLYEVYGLPQNYKTDQMDNEIIESGSDDKLITRNRRSPCWGMMGMMTPVAVPAQYRYASYKTKKDKKKNKDKEERRRRRESPDYFDPHNIHNSVNHVDQDDGIETFLMSIVKATRALIDAMSRLFTNGDVPGKPNNIFSK